MIPELRESRQLEKNNTIGLLKIRPKMNKLHIRNSLRSLKKKQLTGVLSGSDTRRHPQGPACTHTCCHLRTPRVSGRHASNCLTCKGSRSEIKPPAKRSEGRIRNNHSKSNRQIN